MSSQVTLPRLGQGMESGTIVKWLKSEGDRVEKGEPLYELDTEKVTQEVEAEASGVLLKILVSEGEVDVGKPIGVIGEEGEQVEEPEATDAAASADEAEKKEAASAEAGESAEKPSTAPKREGEREQGRRANAEEKPAAAGTEDGRRDGGRVKASPLARRLAKERGIDLASLQGTGPEGRIVAEDVERAGASPGWAAPAEAVSGEVETVKLTKVRRTIARRLSEAWQAPHFQIGMSADMTSAVHLRERLVERAGESGVRPTYSDILTKACAVALLQHREVNAHYAGDEVHLFPTANIGIAVAAEQGLLVPVIRSCERLTIPQIAEARADLVQRTRAGKLTTQDLDGGTFTISNLGMYGVERFVAVLNPPQAAILAVGAIEDRVVVDEDGDVVVEPRLELTLSCDHRAVNGAVASEFLRAVKELLEEPGLMA